MKNIITLLFLALVVMQNVFAQEQKITAYISANSFQITDRNDK